eukprot:6055838-Pleurochrysis_carterae.AAC.4
MLWQSSFARHHVEGDFCCRAERETGHHRDQREVHLRREGWRVPGRGGCTCVEDVHLAIKERGERSEYGWTEEGGGRMKPLRTRRSGKRHSIAAPSRALAASRAGAGAWSLDACGLA